MEQYYREAKAGVGVKKTGNTGLLPAESADSKKSPDLEQTKRRGRRLITQRRTMKTELYGNETMVAEEYKIETVRKTQRAGEKTVVAVVDQWHKEWAKVLTAMDRAGNRKLLMLDKDGWLSARQSVVAAFADGEVIGHLIFHVAPVVSDQGGIELEARVDSASVVGASQEAEVVRLLVGVAEPHARTILQCRSFKWGNADCDA